MDVDATFVAHDDRLVKSPVVSLRAVRAFHQTSSVAATLHGEVALLIAWARSPVLCRPVPSGTYVAGVNAEQRDAERAGTRCGHEERSVAADRQRHPMSISPPGSVIDDVDPLLLKSLGARLTALVIALGRWR